MAALQKDLREFLELCLSRNVEFLVVGAHCLAFRGIPRFTGDIDLWVRRSRQNAEKLVQVLQDLRFGGLQITAEDFLRDQQVIQLGMALHRIDLVTGVDGVDFDEASATREEGELDAVTVCFVSRETLIRNKKAAGRPQDLADVARLWNHPETGKQ